MRVLVVGGTGFIGYHATHELARRGHDVTILGLPPGPPDDFFPESVSLELHDIDCLADMDLDRMLKDFDSVVFAAGADDRTIPDSPAAKFFYNANVKSAARFTAAALRAGVKRFVLVGSYFTFLDREWPHMKLAEHHPYIESRRIQYELCTTIAGPDMALVLLELPYVFGSAPGLVPIWSPLVSYVRSGMPLFYTNGGSNMVSVKSVAQAIAGACEHVKESRIFQVGEENLKWTELLKRLCHITKRDDSAVHIIPDSGLNKVSWLLDALHAIQGRESGLHASHFIRVQTSDAFFDIKDSQAALGYEVGGLDDAMRDTVLHSPPRENISYWKKFSEKAQNLLNKS
jgi:nucleoside-diphosphate-sugar epimerase